MEYYLSNNDGNFSGPYLLQQLHSAGIKRETMVWREGLSAWYPAYLLPELNDVINLIPPPLEITLNAPDFQPPELPEIQQAMGTENMVVQSEGNEPATKAKPVAKKQSKPKKTAAKPVAKEAEKPVAKEAKKPVKKEADTKKSGSQKESKTKYDHPVSPWFNESIWLLAFVLIHALIEVCSDKINITYIYLDIIGAALCITGVIIGAKIKALNKVSYAKDSATRNQAEKLARFNGFFVSATAAAGFLIVLYQTAHYVYVC